MSIQSNVSTGVSKPDATNDVATSKNGVRCHDTSCTCGRVGAAGYSRTQVGQAVISTRLFDRHQNDTAKYKLYMFMNVILGLHGSNKT
jgi:hypothetical protein